MEKSFYNGEMYPCIFIFLKNKSQRVYERMIDEINKNIDGIKSPTWILSDFEKAVMLAFKNKYPNSTIKGCFFHFSQALMKNIQDKGLITSYRTNEYVNKSLNLFKGLAFLPLQMVQHGWYMIYQIKPRDKKMSKNVINGLFKAVSAQFWEIKSLGIKVLKSNLYFFLCLEF
jgi:hypothetical protein